MGGFTPEYSGRILEHFGSFWNILAPSAPFKISQVPNYIFNLNVTIAAQKSVQLGCAQA